MKIAVIKKISFGVLSLAIMLILMQWQHITPIPQINQWIYDHSIQLIHKNPNHADDIVLISINADDLHLQDEEISIKRAIANVLMRLRKAKAKSVSILIPLNKQTDSSSLSYLNNIASYLQNMKGSKRDVKALTNLVNMARTDLDVDSLLAKEILKAKHVYLPFHISKPLPRLPSFFASSTLDVQQKQAGSSMFLAPKRKEQGIIYTDTLPLPVLAKRAYGLGYLSLWYDVADGRSRSMQIAKSYAQTWVASLPLLLTTEIMNLKIKDVMLVPNQHLILGNKTIPVDNQQRILPHFYTVKDKGGAIFKSYTYQQLMNDNISKHLRGKVVLLDAPDLHKFIASPIGDLSVAQFVAHTIVSLLNQDVYMLSPNMTWVVLGVFILIAFYLIMVLPRLRLIMAAWLSLFILFLLVASEAYMLIGQQVWVYGGINILLLVLGGSLVLGWQVTQTFHNKQAQEVAYINKQLGLMLQEKGKLERAFEHFQRLPPSTDHLDLLYHLALDFERKRKFSNAMSVYQHIIQYQPNFKDIMKRMVAMEKMQHASNLGTGQFNTITSLLHQSDEKPMLGRFVLEKELGKGAMGAVYLGRDPKIDRIVAVKTLALAEEFESTEIKEVEQRFFHEASAAGRLNHPNIVTIYDAGEDHDLAYIAMEYIHGKPLSDFTKKDKLLPIPVVLNVVAKIADALDYAGEKGIVHRDIKPANIMYNEENGIVKVTDFGIAHIASSGRTKTGMILGTPSFMSPEQMNGQPVDARSDIFSLGVTMYVLLTGIKPFQGDSLAAISYKIVNDKHPDILTVRKGLPTCIKNIINKALQKDPDKRYQNAGVMRKAILRCLKTITID